MQHCLLSRGPGWRLRRTWARPSTKRRICFGSKVPAAVPAASDRRTVPVQLQVLWNCTLVLYGCIASDSLSYARQCTHTSHSTLPANSPHAIDCKLQSTNAAYNTQKLHHSYRMQDSHSTILAHITLLVLAMVRIQLMVLMQTTELLLPKHCVLVQTVTMRSMHSTMARTMPRSLWDLRWAQSAGRDCEWLPILAGIPLSPLSVSP